MTFEERKAQNEKIKNIGYYLTIGFLSIASTVFLPLLGSSLDGGFLWPSTWEEWLIWGMTRLSIAFVNIGLFYCFIQQAKINVKDDAAYKEALETMGKIKAKKELQPRSPAKYNSRQWLTKGTTIFISSIASCVVLTEALLRFDLTEFLTFLFTIVMGIVMGYLTMRQNEDYWTTEYPLYVKMLQAKMEQESNENKPLA